MANNYIASWEEITQSDQFQGLAEDQKRTAFNNYMSRNVEQREDFQALPPDKKEKFFKSYETMAGLPQQDRMWNVPQESIFKQFARGTFESLPVAGGMFGGALAGGLPPGPTTPLRSVVGAGLGGGAGESMRQMLSQHVLGEMPLPGEAGYAKIAERGLEQAAGEGMGLSMNKIIGKMLAPGAKKLNVAAARFAQENELPISPSSLTTSKTVKVINEAADILPPGDFMIARQRKKVAVGVTKMADDFITDFLDLPPSQLQEEFFQEGRELYQKLPGMAGKAKYKMPNVKQYLDEVGEDLITAIKGKGVKGNKGFFRMVQRELGETGAVEWDRVQNMSAKKWGGKYSKLTPTEKQLWHGFQAAFDKDLISIDKTRDIALGSMLKKADLLYKSGVDARKSKMIEGLFNRSMIDVEGTRYLKPERFKTNLETKIPQLQRAGIPPDKIKLLRQFAKRIQVAEPDIKKIKEAANPARLMLKYAKTGGAGFVGAIAEQPLLAVPAGADVIFAYSIMNPKGWMKKWLTTGFAPGLGTQKLLKESLKPLPQIFRTVYPNGNERKPSHISPEQFITR